MDVRGIPELLWEARRAMADVLRAEARTEASGYVQRRLLAIAAKYEAGVDG